MENMPRLLYIIIMAFLQGITEFLPISSSGHLVLAGKAFGLHEPGGGLEIALHFGTLLSIVVFYWRDLVALVRTANSVKSESTKTIGLVIIASIPAAVIGLAFESQLLSCFDNGALAGAMLILTGIVLLSTLFTTKHGARINLPRAIAIGFAQAAAILPGISRSGITIVTARHTGVEGEKAARFSFFMAIPVIAGANFLHLIGHSSGFDAIHIVGIAISFVIGYISLKVLIKVLDKGKLWVFGPYCLILGIISLIALT